MLGEYDGAILPLKLLVELIARWKIYSSYAGK